jgi:hypothetical protein
MNPMSIACTHVYLTKLVIVLAPEKSATTITVSGSTMLLGLESQIVSGNRKVQRKHVIFLKLIIQVRSV